MLGEVALKYLCLELITAIQPNMGTIFTAMAYSSIFGATFSISIFSDMLSFYTLHLQLFYIISARVFNWALKIIESTFNLFQGKKRNPLRNRIDNAEYDLDQLLLGAVIFTLFFFLLPTVAVYYILFCLVRKV